MVCEFAADTVCVAVPLATADVPAVDHAVVDVDPVGALPHPDATTRANWSRTLRIWVRDGVFRPSVP
jgi:hypothetical protein